MTQDSSLIPNQKNLPAQRQEEITALVKTIDFNDPQLTVTYGARPMGEIARFADNMLGEVRAKDAGPVGQIITDMLLEVRRVDVDKMGDTGGFLAKIPLIGMLFNSLERKLDEMKKVTDQVEAISLKLDKAMVGLLHDVEVLEQLYGVNKSNYEELSIYIEAGKARLEQARNKELPRLKEQADASGDSMQAQAVRDFAERLNRFEKRLHDLQLSRAVTVQTVPQIRLIQSNNQTLAEKIQTSVLTTIPIWKNQMVLAISLFRQKKAVELQKSVSDATNEMLLKNAEMLEHTTIATAREAERSVVDIQTIKQVQQRLMNTLEESLKIATEGRQQRAEVEKELETMEQDLRAGLTSLASRQHTAQLQGSMGVNTVETGSK